MDIKKREKKKSAVYHADKNYGEFFPLNLSSQVASNRLTDKTFKLNCKTQFNPRKVFTFMG